VPSSSILQQSGGQFCAIAVIANIAAIVKIKVVNFIVACLLLLVECIARAVKRKIEGLTMRSA